MPLYILFIPWKARCRLVLTQFHSIVPLRHTVVWIRGRGCHIILMIQGGLRPWEILNFYRIHSKFNYLSWAFFTQSHRLRYQSHPGPSHSIVGPPPSDGFEHLSPPQASAAARDRTGKRKATEPAQEELAPKSRRRGPGDSI